jgi:two-component system nitrate/nitrite response regulator NarL
MTHDPSPLFVARQATPIRVVVADQHPLFLDALARLIRQDRQLELLVEARDPKQLIDALAQHTADVLVIDAAMFPPACDRLSARTLVLAADISASAPYAAIARGARGVLSKDADAAAIRRAIAAVARGDAVLDPSAQTSIATELRLRRRNDRPELSRREREILVLMASGVNAPQIAGKLHIGSATVKTHQLHLYEKLGVAERAAAVAEGMRRGLLE